MRDRLVILTCTTLTSFSLLNCGGAPADFTTSESAPIAAEAGDAAMSSDAGGQLVQDRTPKAAPQLIETADLGLSVAAIAPAVDAIRELTVEQGGDLLNLNITTPKGASEPDNASLTLRVPQQNLEVFLADLSDLGNVTRETISAQDVSDQLVDLAARLRNLRKTEETLLGIMERTGAVADVLKVAQELNNVRAEIERIEAQRQDLSQRVAFSTVNLQLDLAGTARPAVPALTRQLGNTWNQASRSVSGFTTLLLKISLWLLAYSPYLLAIAALVWLLARRRPRRPAPPRETTPPQS